MGAQGSTKIPATTFLGLAVMLAIGGVTFFLTYGLAVPEILRWAVTGAWGLYTIILGIRDFAIGSDASDRDKGAFDLWTISHGGAGLVFGVWYMPIVWVAMLVVLWEVFEAVCVGFGDQESFKNRAMDVGIALVMWALVVVPTALIVHAPFPLLQAYRP